MKLEDGTKVVILGGGPSSGDLWNQAMAISSVVGAAKGAAAALAPKAVAQGARQAAATGGVAASKAVLRKGDVMLGIVKDGKLIAKTTDLTLSHAQFVQRTVGTLPEGARVVTFGKSLSGEMSVFNSMTIHGNQLPAPQSAIDVIMSLYR